MTNLYLSMNDSRRDPTYSAAETCVLVVGPSDCANNPCSDENAQQVCDLIPTDEMNLRIFADMYGWDIGMDNEGQMILYTGIRAE